MPDRIVLVNGLPGAGKSTVATALAGRLGAPLLAKDTIKEAVADAIPVVVPGLGPAVMDLVWRLAAAMPGLVVVDSWWFAARDRQFARDGLRRATTVHVGTRPAVSNLGAGSGRRGPC